MAVCTSSSNIFAFKISLEDWNQTPEDQFLSLPFATSAPNQSLMKMIQWRLDVYPKGESEGEGTKYVEVYLLREDLPHDLDIGQFQVEAAFRFPPKDCDWPISARSFMRFHSSVFENSPNNVGFNMTYEVGIVEDRAVDGILTLEFEMRTYKAPWTKFKYSRGCEEIVNNFLSVDSADGDVKLISEGREIPCHKFLLMTQSPVFKAMFDMNSMEKETNTVKILDSSPDVVEEFVKYLYEGTLSGAKSVELMFGLLNLAEKYQIGLLTDECLDVLIDIMDVDNVLKIYAVIDKLDLGSNVTDLIIDFMKNNIDVIVDKEDWSPFLSDYPSLMKDFVLNISQALKQAQNS